MLESKRQNHAALSIACRLAGRIGLFAALGISAAAAQEVVPVPVPQFTLEDCIRIGLNNQAAIQVQIAAAGAARQQEAIAQSYFYPQVDLQSRFTNASSVYSVALPNPITGPLADVVADSGAYFGIAKQAGSAAAQAALDNPTVSVAPGLPSFNAARQAVLSALPASYDVDLLGQNFLTTQVTLVQPLWTGGKIRYRREQAELGTRAAHSTWKRPGKRPHLTSRGPISRSCWLVKWSMLRTTLRADTEPSRAWLRNLVEQGNEFTTMADTRRAGALRHMAESEKAGLHRVCQRAYAGLRLAMGLDQQMAIQVADQHLMVGEKDFDAADLLSRAIAQRPDLAKAEIGTKVAALERQLAQAAYCPDVGAFASFSNVWDDGHFLNPTHPNEGAVGVGVELPLFVGGRRIAESRQADCRQAEAAQIRRLLSEVVSQEIQDAYLEYKEAAEQMHQEELAVRDGAEAMRILDNQQRGRQIEDKDMPRYFTDLILTQQMFTQALVRYYQSVYNCNVALGRIRLVTACDEYETFVERGGTDARVLDDAGDRAAPDARRQ